jgi:hypothetical protein
MSHRFLASRSNHLNATVTRKVAWRNKCPVRMGGKGGAGNEGGTVERHCTELDLTPPPRRALHPYKNTEHTLLPHTSAKCSHCFLLSRDSNILINNKSWNGVLRLEYTNFRNMFLCFDNMHQYFINFSTVPNLEFRNWSPFSYISASHFRTRGSYRI